MSLLEIESRACWETKCWKHALTRAAKVEQKGRTRNKHEVASIANERSGGSLIFVKAQTVTEGWSRVRAIAVNEAG